MNFSYLKKDIQHYIAIFPITLFVFLFYVKYGFYGWTHLLSVLFIQYAGLPIDDWLDEGRPFPFLCIAYDRICCILFSVNNGLRDYRWFSGKFACAHA